MIIKDIYMSYNAIGRYKRVTVKKLRDGRYALILPFTFCPDKKTKGPRFVIVSDKKFQKALIYIIEVERVIVFIGKESSGSIAMIDLICRLLGSLASKVFWVVCDHDLEEKLLCLEKWGISRESPNVFIFKDNVHPCREEYILLGLLASA